MLDACHSNYSRSGFIPSVPSMTPRNTPHPIPPIIKIPACCSHTPIPQNFSHDQYWIIKLIHIFLSQIPKSILSLCSKKYTLKLKELAILLIKVLK